MIKRRKNIVILILSVILSATFSYKASASFPSIKRLGGNDRYDTCVKVAQDGWSSSYYAVIACGENYPDALSSVSLAKKYNAPILLTYSNSMPVNVMAELKHLQVGKVFLIGGQGSINSKIEANLNSQGIQTERLGGADRYETSIKIAEKFGKPKALTVATGEDYADALSIGPAAAAMGVPVILVPKNIMPQCTKDYIRNLNNVKNTEYTTSEITENSKYNKDKVPEKNQGEFKKYEVFIMGDSNIISDNISGEFEGNTIERIIGENKYVRNINAIARFIQKTKGVTVEKGKNDDKYKETQYATEDDMLSLNNLYLASGEGFADALSGAALAAKTKSPIMMSSASNASLINNFLLSKNPNNNYGSNNPEYITVLGGEGVMPQNRVSQIFGNIAFDSTVQFNDSSLVTFKDKAFEKAIRDKLNIHDREIHYSDVRNITSLELSNESIGDITGLQNFTGLKSLDLSCNQIKELWPILRLDQIENLNLSNNKIEDISYISNLVSLKELNLSDNNIDNLDHSRKMYKESGETDYDKTSDNVFKKLNHITSLDLSNSNVVGYSYNNRNRIRSVSNLKDISNLVSLNLKGNDVSNLDDLKDLKDLRTLNLSYTGISNLDFTKNLKGITYLDISNNSSIESDDLKPLKDLTGLKYLNASNDKIDSVASLSNLTNLTTLYIEDNPIKDYTPILPYYKSLYYKDFNIWSIVGDVSYSKDAMLDSQIKDQIISFQTMYGYGDYNKLRYRQLYHAYDLGTVKEISGKDNMNGKVKDLENQLSATYKPIEREKLINRINYVYADYRYDYYRNLVDTYNNDMDKIKERLQVAGTESPNYESANSIEYLQYKLDQVKRDRDFAGEKIDMYERYKDFLNAVNSVLEEI